MEEVAADRDADRDRAAGGHHLSPGQPVTVHTENGDGVARLRRRRRSAARRNPPHTDRTPEGAPRRRGSAAPPRHHRPPTRRKRQQHHGFVAADVARVALQETIQGCPARCWAPRGVIQIPVSGTPPRTSATTTRRCLMRQITELGSGDLQLQPTAASAHRAILTSSS